mgnify:FL=1|jgi:hypothetical protein
MSGTYKFDCETPEVCRNCEEEYSNPAYTNICADVVICNLCANTILNVVHKAQYGTFFSWTEETPVLQKGYKKKHIGNSLRMAVYERDGFKCVTCGIQKNLTCDHIKPESIGGETTFENLQTMCKSCNSSKGARYVKASD